jgi:macrolide transport system ATP-binding/permease protein
VSIFSWFKRRRLDEDDFQEEMRTHLALASDARVADGDDPDAARLASLKEFGNLTLTAEAARKVWTPRWIDAVHDLLSDIRYATRALRKNRAFSLTVVGVLTLGIGLNAAVFTMLKGIAFSPIAGVDGAARSQVLFRQTSTGRKLGLSYPDYQYLRDHDRAFSGLFGSTVATLGLGRGRSARQIWGEFVTGNYFDVLGVRAQRGRPLLPSDELAPGRHPVIVLSDGLWRRDFGADPDILGRTVELNNFLLTVVGVADPAFHGTTVVYDVEVFIPVMTAPQLGFTFGSQQTTPSGIMSDRNAAIFVPQGYLRPGTSPANAAAQADALWTPRLRDRPLIEGAERLRVAPFWQSPNGAPLILLPTLGVLSAMGLLVLLIACANIAGVVLVRGLSRRGEIAVRLALGARRVRIVRLLVVENLVLAVPGAIFGALLARAGIPVLVDYAESLAAPQRIFFNVGIDGTVIGFALLIGCASALVFGFVPALQSSRVDLVSIINADASPRGAARGRLRTGLVVAQVAVSLLLLVGAGLAARSVDAARRANPGFDVRHVSAIAINVKQNAYDEARGRVFYRQLLKSARADAGVESATLAEFSPLAFLDSPARRVSIENYEPRRGEDLAFMSNTVGPDYFRTLRIPLLAGREFEDRDDESAPPAAIVNNTLAQRFWGSAANAIGKRIRLAGPGGWRTVVGVAADVKYARIDESPRSYVYTPFLQWYRSGMILHTRGMTSADATGAGSSQPTSADHQLVEQARARVAALDPELPILRATPMADTTRGAMMLFDLMATMLFIFGIAGMALAALGTYGLVSYAVKQSTHEIGIRMALGASGPAVVREFVVRGLRLGVIGAALGIVASLAAARLLGSMLFGISAMDVMSFARALALVLGIVLIASVVPAWRAARTNPLSALRHR